MDRTVVPLFSSPVLISEIDIEDRDLKSSLEYVKTIEYEKNYDRDGYDNGYISINQRILDESYLKKIKDCIEDELKFYLYDFLRVDKKIGIRQLSSWAVKHRYGDKSNIHMHMNSLFSGVLYLKVPENSGNKLSFENLLRKSFEMRYEEYNIYNSNEWIFDVKEKTIIIFPSHMYHKAPISKSNSERYCISFNYFITGELGVPTSYASF